MYSQIVGYVVVVCALSWTSIADADEPDEILTLPDIVVTGTASSNLDAASQHRITEQDIELQSGDRPGNLLRLVPGLITTNPGGGPGKGVRRILYRWSLRPSQSSHSGQSLRQSNAVIMTAKGNVVLGPWAGTEVFFNIGTGFHSNDARAVVSDSTVQTLPKATGYEVGLRTRQWERVEASATFWLLDLTSELVFQGNLGTTQIFGPTRRYGTDLGGRLQLLDWLSVSGSVTLNTATFRETGEAVPQAPTMTSRSELTARLPSGLTASFQMLHPADGYDESLELDRGGGRFVPYYTIPMRRIASIRWVVSCCSIAMSLAGRYSNGWRTRKPVNR